MNKKYSIIILFVTVFNFLSAQEKTFTIKGSIMHFNSPIPFANVYVKGTQLGTASDKEGVFTIQRVPADIREISISAIGFLPKKISFKKTLNDHLFLEIFLDEDPNFLEEVVISGQLKEVSKADSPVPIEVYKAGFFKKNPSPNIFESFQNINGVRPQINCNICNTGDIHINGLEGPYTMILIDGMPIVSGLSTVYGLNGIPSSLIDRIEIVKGPAGTLYGSQAVGGLINVITKNTSDAPLMSSEVYTSSWGEVNTDIGLTYRLGKNVNALLGLNYFNYQLPKDSNHDGFTDISLQHRISIFNKFSVKRPDQRAFNIALRYVYEDRWGGEMDWNPNNRGGEQVYGESIYTSRWEALGTYDLPTDEEIKFQWSANGHIQNAAYGNMLYNASQYVGFAQLFWNKTVNKNDWLVGITHRYNYYNDNTTATENTLTDGVKDQPSITQMPGVFVQNEIKWNSQNSLLLGLRYDYNSIHGGIISPRFNYKWTSKDKFNTLRWSLGNGYRVANVFTEDHAALTGARTVIFKEALKPERSWNTNLNFVKKIYTDQGTFIGIDSSLFYTYFTNQILPDYLSNPNQIIYDNLKGYAISKGVSLNLEANMQNGLKINTGATLMEVSIVEDNIKTRQLLTERFQGVWSISYLFKGIQTTLDYTGNLYGPMRLPLLGPLDNRPEYSPWWSLQNIQLTKIIPGGWELFGGLKNILNLRPPSNSIARAFDPFDKEVLFNNQGLVVPTPNNPNALSFDPTYMFAPNQGIRGFIGIRYALK